MTKSPNERFDVNVALRHKFFLKNKSTTTSLSIPHVQLETASHCSIPKDSPLIFVDPIILEELQSTTEQTTVSHHREATEILKREKEELEIKNHKLIQTINNNNAQLQNIKTQADQEKKLYKKKIKNQNEKFLSVEMENKRLREKLRDMETKMVNQQQKPEKKIKFVKKKTIKLNRLICDVCGKDFQLKKMLNRHVQIHGTQNYVCEICGKSFKLERYLKRHEEIHQTKKRFKCSICDKAFNTNSKRTHHIKKVHK